MEQLEENVFNDVLFIVLLYKNDNFGVRAPYDIEILGKKMWEWVALAGSGATIKTTPCTEESDIISLIKPFVGSEKYTMVFYSDTPLISKHNVIEIFDYFKSRNLNALKLKRGYMFDSEFLLNAESILGTENQMFNGEEFEPVNNFSDVSRLVQKFNEQILNYHMENGVFIVDPKTTYIDADVVIEKGVRIEQNNVIKGESYIGENSVLEPNNIIKDSVISQNVILKSSYISGSRVGENMIVGPFETVIDKNVWGSMKLIVGLGNFESKYNKTYHNVGFRAVDFLAEKLGASFTKRMCDGVVAETFYNGEKVLLVKPLTYMNLSGICVEALARKFKIKEEDICIFVDDIDLPLGKIRFRESGSAGTHNGLKSIVGELGSTNFRRLKFGIGRDEKFADLADFVLSKIPEDILKIIDAEIEEGINFLLGGNFLKNNKK